MRITSKGQVTIPIEIREKAGLLPGTEIAFVLEGKAARIVRVVPRRGQSRGGRIVGRLRGSATTKLSTDEILALTRRR